MKVTISAQNIKKERIAQLLSDYPFLLSYFSDNNLEIESHKELTVEEFFSQFDEETIEDKALDIEHQYNQIAQFINQMNAFLGNNDEKVQSITILPGQDKSGNSETFERMEIKQGEIICIVGPTGSGKSRLLGDIEWVAQNDTPTMRTILINNDKSANALAGESFKPQTPITSLSGGQSRALMIADTAILSKSPIILIDEIENAGIDRKQALDLLLSEDKVVLMATHDPILALMGDKRIVIKNGGINKIIETTEKEREILSTLEEMDKKILAYRTSLRNGEILTKTEGEN